MKYRRFHDPAKSAIDKLSRQAEPVPQLNVAEGTTFEPDISAIGVTDPGAIKRAIHQV
jgi:hypothetical protein